MFTRHHFVLIVAVLCSSVEAQTETGESEAAQLARVILEETNMQGGVVATLNCGNPSARGLVHALRPNDSFLVHALDSNADNVDEIRNAIRAQGFQRCPPSKQVARIPELQRRDGLPCVRRHLA